MSDTVKSGAQSVHETPLYRAQLAISAAWIGQRYGWDPTGWGIKKAVKALAKLSPTESHELDAWLLGLNDDSVDYSTSSRW